MSAVVTKIRVNCPTPRCASAYSVTVADLEKSLYCQQCKKKFRLPHFDEYLVLEELGRGSFGVVCRVYDLKEHREAAIKLLNTDALPADKFGEWVERARTEAQVIANIVHPNIMPLHRSGIHKDKFYMVTPLLPGQTLSSWITEGGFEDQVAAVEIVVLVLRALHFVHGLNICHRDVKPGNIMVDDGGKIVYLMDFGLAVLQEKGAALKEDGVITGTIEYMPPEQAKGDGARVGPRADQYSAGVVLYKFLTGKLPYAGRGIAMLKDIVDPKRQPISPRKHRSDLDPDLEKLILRSIEKLPERRFPNCEEFADELQEWIDNWKAMQRQPQSRTALSRKLIATGRLADDGLRPTGRKWLWTALAPLLLIGLGTAAYFAFRGSDESKNPSTSMPTKSAAPAVNPKEITDWTK